MGILSWIILGLLAGLIAKAIRPGKDPGGWIITIIIGLLGSVVGGWIGSALGWGTVNEFSIRTLLLSTGGAVIVLWIFALLRKK
ncbi:MAG: GlsB/YeaQ/YmgE family stress response membrane protein [Tannerella sp.]|uniref:GlsB/YeaQ/YmgE family stress response membrane protein n=1 Tax=Tannerella sp. TaxID=2382127 RepID=UPI003FA302FE